jgi:hypothetical protein
VSVTIIPTSPGPIPCEIVSLSAHTDAIETYSSVYVMLVMIGLEVEELGAIANLWAFTTYWPAMPVERESATKPAEPSLRGTLQPIATVGFTLSGLAEMRQHRSNPTCTACNSCNPLKQKLYSKAQLKEVCPEQFSIPPIPSSRAAYTILGGSNSNMANPIDRLAAKIALLGLVTDKPEGPSITESNQYTGARRLSQPRRSLTFEHEVSITQHFGFICAYSEDPLHVTAACIEETNGLVIRIAANTGRHDKLLDGMKKVSGILQNEAINGQFLLPIKVHALTS